MASLQRWSFTFSAFSFCSMTSGISSVEKTTTRNSPKSSIGRGAPTQRFVTRRRLFSCRRPAHTGLAADGSQDTLKEVASTDYLYNSPVRLSQPCQHPPSSGRALLRPASHLRIPATHEHVCGGCPHIPRVRKHYERVRPRPIEQKNRHYLRNRRPARNRHINGGAQPEPEGLAEIRITVPENLSRNAATRALTASCSLPSTLRTSRSISTLQASYSRSTCQRSN